MGSRNVLPCHDPKSIEHILYEVTATLQHIEKTLERNQNTLLSLLESKAEHTIEIKFLSSGMDRIYDEIKKMDFKVARVETLLENKKERSIPFMLWGRFLEAVREYWHIIVFLTTAISCAVSFIFGTKLNN